MTRIPTWVLIGMLLDENGKHPSPLILAAAERLQELMERERKAVENFSRARYPNTTGQ